MSQKESQQSVEGQLIYPTDHLKNFDLLDRAIALIGEKYRVAKKLAWYITHGEIIKKQIIQLGGIRIDCRVSAAFVFPSGHGKKHIEEVLRKIGLALDQKVSKPTSYHPEQLVGKIIRIDDKKLGKLRYEQVMGHFADDMIIFDDAIDLVKGKEPQYRESRKYLEQALDPIGENQIEKKAVDIPRDHALKYCPECTVIMFFQPFPLDEDAFLSGLFRRIQLIYIGLEQDINEDQFGQKVLGDSKQEEAVSSFASYLRGLKDNPPKQPSLDDLEVKQLFNKLHLDLLNYAKSFGKKSCGFADIIGYSLQNLLLKMATILAYSQGKDKVKAMDVEMAFVDLLEFFHSTLEFVEKKVSGSLDYGETWRGATGRDQELLRWLHQEGALSKDVSKVAIQEYRDKIQGAFNVTKSGAQKHYQRHKRMGWIQSQQVGSHSSRVWLSFKPLIKDEGDQGDRVIKVYMEIIEWVLPLSSTCNFNELGKSLDKGNGEVISVPSKQNNPHTRALPIGEDDTGRGITLPSLPPTNDEDGCEASL